MVLKIALKLLKCAFLTPPRKNRAGAHDQTLQMLQYNNLVFI
jgi:hypothetical protein